MITLSPGKARYLALQSQGLTTRRPFGRGMRGVVRALERIGYAQIDTISVVQRAHHHVMWSRVPDYDPGSNNAPSMLDRLMNRRDGVFEYWSHAAAFLPMADYRYSLFRKHRLRSSPNRWFRRDDGTIQYVLDRITAEGPLAAKDFKDTRGKPKGGWWEWKPAKRALEQLFLDGTLMVKERRGFQKVFDLAARVLPDGVDQTVPDRDNVVLWIIRSSLRAHGIATLPEIAYAYPRLKPAIATALREMEEAGQVVPCRIHGTASAPYYCLSDDIENPPRIRYSNEVNILNPFDNAVIQRRRLKALFGFDYVFECYVPAAKRRFGYFSLPLLHRDRFIGLADCKAHRKEGRLEVKAIHILDPRPPKDFQEKLEVALERFAAFNGVQKVAMPRTTRPQCSFQT